MKASKEPKEVLYFSPRNTQTHMLFSYTEERKKSNKIN